MKRQTARVPALVLAIGSLLACGAHLRSQAIAPATGSGTVPSDDKYLWLEDVSSDRSMAWVKAENARTSSVLEADPHYAPFFAEALKISQDPQRLPVPTLRGGEVYNFWRDASNPRGLSRKTSIADYLSATPHWTSVIDFDALGKAENVGWVNHGMNCLYPDDQHCLVSLSAGGEDATTDREFDLKANHFVPAGFTLPHSKQSVSWLDEDTLLLGRDWGPGTMTTSGYPFVTREWKRGTPLESAKEIFRGEATDVSAGAFVLKDAQGDSLTLFNRSITFFENQTFVQTPAGVKRLTIPAKADIAGVLAGRLLLQIREDWTPTPGKSFHQGSLLELQIADLMKDPAHLKPAPIFEPSAQEFLEGVSTTRDRLVLTTLEHVQARAYVYAPATGETPGKATWTRQRLPLADNVAAYVVTASQTDNSFFLYVTGFLTPPAVWLGDAVKGEIHEAKSQPAQFDSSKLAVDQHEATSTDGTKVPYFVVHPKGYKLDGSHPTLLNAYGGFEVSMTPNYSANLGKLWLERGGVYVLANIRGGGEFGPAWHEAGLKTHRQRIYDDFAAVGEDLVKRGITSPAKLGIEGGSNGGLLMGVEMLQHPDLWKAVVIQVPLLDMLRFEQIAAGASWVGEYGSVANPGERTFLASISPYNQLKPGLKLPEPLIFTTTKDDRVGPQHARKFAAKMEEFHEPFFYQEITEGGHGAGADLKQEAGTWALTYTYLTRELMK